MRRMRLILPVLFLILLAFDVFQGIHYYNASIHKKILSTPHGLSLYPLSPELGKKYFYFQKFPENPEMENRGVSVYFFSPILGTIGVYFLTSMLLFLFARIRKIEKAFLIFTLFLILNLLFFFDLVTVSQFYVLFFITSLFINIPYLYLFRTLHGYSTHPRILILLVLIFAALSVYLIPESSGEEIRFFRVAGFIHIAFIIYSVVFYLKKRNTPGRNSIITSKSTRSILTLALIGTVAFPALSYLIATFFDIKISISHNVLFFLPSVFPMLFFFFALRQGIIYFEIPVPGVFLRFSYFTFFLFLFWFTVGFHLVQIPYNFQHMEFHFGIALVFMLLLETIRGLIYSTLQKSNVLYRESLLKSFASIASSNNPRNVALFLRQLDKIVQNSLNISWMKVVVRDDVFPEWTIDYSNIIFLPQNNPLWNHRKFIKKAISYPYFTGVTSAITRDFLQKNGAFLVIAYQDFPAMVLISEKVNQMPFNTEDINFLRQFLKQTEPYFKNYQFLITNIHLRRRERELELVSRIQKKILPEKYKDRFIHYSGIFAPSQLVTGDYLDLVKIKSKKYLMVLGDVSGHGLGSAYIMSILRTIIRGSVQINRDPLWKTFVYLNEFLGEQYQGSDFMTLFAMEVTLNPGETNIRFINAGQHAAGVYLKKSNKLIFLKENQRVLGVVATDYQEREISFREDIRIILYSDGAFETVKNNGEMIGEQKLRKWIRDSVNLSPEDQKDHLYKKITARAHKDMEMDDISLMIADINLDNG